MVFRDKKCKKCTYFRGTYVFYTYYHLITFTGKRQIHIIMTGMNFQTEPWMNIERSG